MELRNIVAEDNFKGIITLETSTLGNSGAGEVNGQKRNNFSSLITTDILKIL